MGVNSRDVELNLEGNDHTGRATRSAGNNLDRLRRKVTRFNTDTKMSMLKSGSDSAQAFFQSFLRGLTFGKLGATVDSKMGPQFARMGIRLGGVFAVGLAGAVLAQAGNIILAGLPLILGPALLALPLIGILKKQANAAKEQEASLKKLEGLRKRLETARSKDAKKRIQEEMDGELKRLGVLRKQAAHLNRLKGSARRFMDVISKPLQPTVFRLMDRAGRLLDKFGPRFSKMIKGLAPGFEKLVGGVMDGVVAFITALEPAIPGINAGMKEWGKQAPKIGKGIGDAIAAILKDPKKVQDAVRNTADLLRGAADSAVDLAAALVTISQKYKTLSEKVNKFEESTGSQNGGPLGGMWKAVKRNAPKILTGIRSLGLGIQRQWNKIYAKASDFASRTVQRVVAWFKRLPSRAGAAISHMWASLKKHFDEAVHGGGGRARAVVSTAVRFLKRLPAAAGRAVAGLWGHMKGAFQTVLDGVTSFAGKIAAKVRTILGLKAKASGNAGGGGGGSTSWANGMSWGASAMAGARTAGPTQVNVAAPNVAVSVRLDSREIRAIVRSEIREANKGDAYRARIGRR